MINVKLKKISKCICEKSRYLKSIVDDSVNVWNQSTIKVISNVSVIDSVSRNVTNVTISTNVTNTVSINVHNKNMLHAFLLVTILLFMVNCYHYAKHMSKLKKYWHTSKLKIEKKIN